MRVGVKRPISGKGGAERLVLAVDAANKPDVEVYAAADFATWDQRSVFPDTFELVASVCRTNGN
jgi:hypothetical protein